MFSLKEKFGMRIKEIRKKRGYTQEQIAGKIGIEPPNISKLEKGTHFPQPENIEKIAKALNVDIKELFNFDHHQNKKDLRNEIDKILDNNPEKLQDFYKIIKALTE